MTARRRPRPAAVPAPLPEDDQKWLATTDLAVLQCRDLRHAWPRQPATKSGKGTTGLPMSTPNISWTVISKGPPIVLRARNAMYRQLRCQPP